MINLNCCTRSILSKYYISNAILTEIPRNTQLQLFLYDVLGSLEDNDTIEGKRLLTDTILGSNWRQKKNRFWQSWQTFKMDDKQIFIVTIFIHSLVQTKLIMHKWTSSTKIGIFILWFNVSKYFIPRRWTNVLLQFIVVANSRISHSNC